MRLVRFLRAAIHGDMLMQPGDEKLVEDGYDGPHVMDVATGEVGAAPAPAAQAAFRADLAHGGAAPLVAPATEEEARAFGAQIGGVVGAVIDHLWAEIDRLREALKAAGAQEPGRFRPATAPAPAGDAATTELVSKEPDQVAQPEPPPAS